MFNDTIAAFVEGRGSLASIERAIQNSANPLRARAEVEKELAMEWALKSAYVAIAAPPLGLQRTVEALQAAVAPFPGITDASALEDLHVSLKDSFSRMSQPLGGCAGGLERLKAKLAEAPIPEMEGLEAVQDIAPCFDEAPLAPRLLGSEHRKRKSARKIIQMPKPGAIRDVLAAGKDLPENPDDLPPETPGLGV